MGRGATQLSFGELRAGAGRWFKEHARRAIITAVIGFAVGWVINVWVMAIRYDGYRAGPSALATADGNIVNGGLFFGVLAMLVVGVVSYGFGVGWSQFRSDLAAVPGVIVGLIAESGGRAWSLILWSAAVLMLVSGLIAPGVSAVLGLGLLAVAPSALSQVAGRFFVRLWVEVVAFVAPAKRPRVSGLGGSLIGLTGGAVGLLLASQVDTTSVRVVLAALMVGGAYLIVAQPGMSAGVVVVFGGLGLVWVVSGAFPALADDGGWLEFQFSNPDATWWDWLTHGDTQRVLVLGVGGGFATGFGSAVGAAIGSVLSTVGAPSLGGTTWHDPNAPAATSTGAGTPVGTGPATTTTIILEGDEARATLDAWRQSQAGGPDPVIDIPEDEQWRVNVSAEGMEPIREGHIGTQGTVTNVGGIVTGEDGSIAIIIDVEVTRPVPPGGQPGGGSGVPGSTGTAGASGSTGLGGAGGGEDPDTSVVDDGETGADTADESSAAEAEETEPPSPPSDPGDSDDAAGSESEGGASGVPGLAPTATDAEGEAEADEPEPEDGAEPAEATADWARAALTGKLPPDAVDDITGFLTDPERTEVAVAPRISGTYGSIVGQPENTENGVRIPLSGIGHVDLTIEDGQLVVRATPGALGRTVDLLSSLFSSESTKLPSFDDVNRGAADSSARINAAMESTGRTFTGVEALPDGSIRLVAASD